jgi:hypothetical protein
VDPSLFTDVDPAGAALYFAIMGVILVGCIAKLFAGSRWDDWLDERWGRGSVRDWWLLRRMERDAGVEPGSTP